jgi:hypothetical protein
LLINVCTILSTKLTPTNQPTEETTEPTINKTTYLNTDVIADPSTDLMTVERAKETTNS